MEEFLQTFQMKSVFTNNQAPNCSECPGRKRSTTESHRSGLRLLWPIAKPLCAHFSGAVEEGGHGLAAGEELNILAQSASPLRCTQFPGLCQSPPKAPSFLERAASSPAAHLCRHACASPNPVSPEQTAGGPVNSGSQVASMFLGQPS